MAAPRRRGGGASSSSESDGPRRKIHRSDRARASDASPDDRSGGNSKRPDAPDSRVSSHRDRERRRETRPSSGEDSDSEARGGRRRSMEQRRKPRRHGDVSSDDDRRENRNMRREEALPPPPPLPPPPRMPGASSGRNSRVLLGEERGDREREREGRRDQERGIEGPDDDSDPEGRRRRGRRSMEEHHKRHRHDGVSSDDDRRENRDLEPKQRGSDKDIQWEESLPPPPPMPPMTTASVERHSQVLSGEGKRDQERGREGRRDRERGREGRDEYSGSEGRGRGRRLEQRHKGRRVGDGSSEDEDRRREIRDIRAERYRWSDDSSSPHNRDSRNLEVLEQRGAVNDTREEEALPPPPPGPPPQLMTDARRDSRLSFGQARREGERERPRGGGRSSDGDSESDGRGRGRRLKDPRRHGGRGSDDDDHRRENRDRKRERNRRPDDCSSSPLRKQHRENHNGDRDLGEAKQREADKDVRKEEALPPPPPMAPMRNNDREGHREGHQSSDDDSDSEGRGRGRRLKEERRKRERRRHSDESSDDDDDRRRGRRDRKRERNHRSDEENRERGHRDSRRKRNSDTRNSDQDTRKEEPLPPPPPLPPMPDALAGRTGGIYIPPFRMAQMMREVEDKSSEAYQRLSWDALRKSINGLVNKVNATNIKNIIPELLSENLIRGRGLFCRSCMKSQMASPGFTDVFSALVAVVNTKFPDLGKLLLKRIVLQLKRAYKRNDKPQLLAATKFIAHLVNQQVAHEIIALELLTLLLENPTDDSVEVAVGFVKECGAILQDLSPQGLYGIFERFRGILHEAELDKRVRYLIEDLFGIRRAKFEGYPAVRPELDLVEQEDQCIHEISLEDDDIDPETNLDVFKQNPNFLDDEKAYENLKRNILGAESSEDDDSEAVSEDNEEEESEEDDEEKMEIRDETETNLVNLRRTIYLTIMSSVDFEEAGHKLLKIKLEPGQEMELCIMLLECCSQERTYLRYYGLLGQRFCMINRVHQENFETCFVQQYSMIHRLETNKLRNVAKFFAHLLGTSALPWHVLAYIRLTEEDTTSSSRIFIKILFQELSEHLGIRLLNERLNDPLMQESFESIFPKDNPKNTRFSINFFTSIGLGGITESLREYLKNMPRLIMQQSKPVADSDQSGSSSSGSESDSESDSSSDESERRRKRRRK